MRRGLWALFATVGLAAGCGGNDGGASGQPAASRARDLRCEQDADCRTGERCVDGVDGGAAFPTPQCTCLCDVSFSCETGCACDPDCRSTASSFFGGSSRAAGSSGGGGGGTSAATSRPRSSSRPTSATCGDGIVDAQETCDGNCPTSCNDNNPCTVDQLRGSAAQCTASCDHDVLTACTNNDQCCPAGCNASRDNDCSASCGDGVLQTGETCDGNCPTSCNDGQACTADRLIGAQSTCTAQCLYDTITSCVSGDGCCAAGCNRNNDGDCATQCGNAAVEPGETCDGNCPSSCDDFQACTRDNRSGSASSCNVECTHSTISQCSSGDGCCPSGCNRNTDSDCAAQCGNGILESGETCDGNCPSSCDDGNSCTVDARTGTSTSCNVRCTNTPPPCTNADGCCPAGCNATNDNDCYPQCGNGVVESWEECDGNCPTSCASDGNACTADVVTGSAQYCDAVCAYQQTINSCIDGDGCCPRDRCSIRQDSDCTCSLYGQFCQGSADCCAGYRCLGAPATGYRCYND